MIIGTGAGKVDAETAVIRFRRAYSATDRQPRI